MVSRQGRNSGSSKHKRRTGDVYRCLKCVLLCLLSSEPFSSVHYRAAFTHSMPHIMILAVCTSAPNPSGRYKATYHSLEGRWSGRSLLGQPGTRARCGESPSCVQAMTSTSALEPALWVPAHNTAAPQCARNYQSLRLLVTQNLCTKGINLNHFLWVNHFNLETDSTDICKKALLDAIYFCIGGNNVDWSHKKNYKS